MEKYTTEKTELQNMQAKDITARGMAYTVWLNNSEVTTIGAAGGLEIDTLNNLTPIVVLPDSGVVAGSYTNMSGTINAQGRLTLASSGTPPILSLTGTANQINVTAGQTPTLSLGSTELVTLATYNNTGLITRTGTAAYKGCTIKAGATNFLTVANGDGILGNPTIEFTTTNISPTTSIKPILSSNSVGLITSIIAAPAPTMVVFTSGSGNWLVPANVTRIRVTLIGGGGGGGGGANTNAKLAGGGGAGATTIGYLTVTPGANIAYSVGVGGAGGAAFVNSPPVAAGNGITGTITSFSTLTANGGIGGTNGNAAVATGGAGGAASSFSGSTISFAGASGNDAGNTGSSISGSGGNSSLGGAGKGVQGASAQAGGNAVPNTGAGAGGGIGGTAAGTSGGNAANGLILIETL